MASRETWAMVKFLWRCDIDSLFFRCNALQMFSEQTFTITTNAIICTQPSLTIIVDVMVFHDFFGIFFLLFLIVFSRYIQEIFMVFHFSNFTFVNYVMFLLKHQDRWF